MSAISEIDEAEIWLYDTLTNDATVSATFGDNIGHTPLPRESATRQAMALPSSRI